MTTINLTNYLTTAQAAKRLGLKGDTLKKYCQTGAIKAIKGGTSWLIAKKEVERYKRETLGKMGRK